MHILIIGGSGSIGLSLITESLKRNHSVFAISLSPSKLNNPKLSEIICNRHDNPSFTKRISEITSKTTLDLIVDVIPFGFRDAKQTYDLFKSTKPHIITISSTLVYDRVTSPNSIVTPNHPLAKTGTQGGYTDRKIEVEQFWKAANYNNWSILRPHHIIGPNTLIGCIPAHNRDPSIISKIREGKPIKLFNMGEILTSYIHPVDLANLILGIACNEKSFNNCYNAVFHESIFASVYYKKIGEILNTSTDIQPLNKNEVLTKHPEWQLTCFNHTYQTDDLNNIYEYEFKLDIEKCLRDAIQSPFNTKQNKQPEIFDRIQTPPILNLMNLVT